MTKLTLTAKLHNANLRIAELEAKLIAQARSALEMADRADDELARMQSKFATAEAARMVLAVKAIPPAPATPATPAAVAPTPVAPVAPVATVTPARAAYLARSAEFKARVAAETAAYKARSAAARELAMRTGLCVRM